MNQKTKIIIYFTSLILLLSLVWYFNFPPQSDNRQINPTPSLVSEILDPDIFGIRYDQSLGWSKTVSDIQNTDQLQSETINFRKESFEISVNISLIKNNATQTYTGYLPDTREYLSSDKELVKVGNYVEITVGRIETFEGYILVDSDSKLLRDNQTTFIYELPILVSKTGYTTKTIIKYFNKNTADNSLLFQADKLILSFT